MNLRKLHQVPLVVQVALLALPSLAQGEIRILTLAPATFEPAVTVWREHRTQESGNCYPASDFVVNSVTTEEIDLSPFGNQNQATTREEIRSYLFDLLSSPPDAPDYLLIIGHPDPNIVPYDTVSTAEGWFIYSDDSYVDVNRDHVPDIAVGRLPALSLTGALAMVEKVVSYDNVSWFYGDGVGWVDDVMTTEYDVDNVCANGIVCEGQIVATSMDHLTGSILPDVYRDCGTITRGKGTTIPGADNLRRSFVMNNVNAGRSLWIAAGTAAADRDLVRFLSAIPGHDSQFDPALFNNDGLLPVLLAPSCNIGYLASGALLTGLMEIPNGGAVAAIAPTGPVEQVTALTFLNETIRVSSEVPVCGEYRPLGSIVAEVKQHLIGSGIGPLGLWNMMYYGDPTMRLPMWGKFVEITGVGPSLVAHPNQWIQVRASQTDQSLPPDRQWQHSYTWSASKGLLCDGYDGLPDSDCVPPGEHHWTSVVWYRCRNQSGIDENCVPGSPAQLDVSVVEGFDDFNPPTLYPCNSADSTVGITFKEVPGGGCPAVFIYRLGQWQESNSILGECAYKSGTAITTDYYDIPERVVGASPYIDIRVKETTQGELTNLDFAEFWVVDHPNATKVWLSQSGTIWKGDSLSGPVGARIASGPSILPELVSAEDDLVIAVAEGDSFLVIFNDSVHLPTTGRVAVNARAKRKYSEAAEGDEPYGLRCSLRLAGGIVIAGEEPLLPRKNWHTGVLDEPTVVRGDGLADTVAFWVGEYHELDHVALIENATEWTEKTVIPLSTATLSNSGNVTASLATADGVFTTLRLDEYVTLRFAYPSLPGGMKREIILRVQGGYELDGSFVDPNATSPDLPWGVTALIPNPSRGEMVVAYNRGGLGLARLAVYDVGGRLVRSLEDPSKGRGTGSLLWDGRDRDGLKLASGIYFVRLSEGARNDTRKLVLLR